MTNKFFLLILPSDTTNINGIILTKIDMHIILKALDMETRYLTLNLIKY